MKKTITLDKVFVGDNVDIKLKNEEQLHNFYDISIIPNSKHFGSQNTDVDVNIDIIGHEVTIPIAKSVCDAETREKIKNYTTSINGKNFGDHTWYGKYGQYIDETSGQTKLVYKVGSKGYNTYTKVIDNFIVSGHNNPENGFTLLGEVTLVRGKDTTNEKILQVINYNRICDQIVDSSGNKYEPDGNGYISKDVTKDEKCKITLKRWNKEDTITIDTSNEIKQYDMKSLNNDIDIYYNNIGIKGVGGKLIIDDNTYIQFNTIYTTFKKLDLNFEYMPSIKKYLNVTFEYNDFQDKSTETTEQTSGGIGSAGNVVEYNSSDGVLSILNNYKCSRRKGVIKFNAIGCNERCIYLSQNGAPLWIKNGNNYVKEIIINDTNNLGHANSFYLTLYTGVNDETGCVLQEFKDDTKLKMEYEVTKENDATVVVNTSPKLYKYRSSGHIIISIPDNDISNYSIKYQIKLYYDSNGNNKCDTDNESYVTITIIQSPYDQGWS